MKTTSHILFAIIAAILCMIPLSVYADGTYGSGNYGACQYSSCSISLSSQGLVEADIIPAGGATTCTVKSDSVVVTTDSSTGYTLTLNDSDTVNTMTRSGGVTIDAVAGTSTSPTVLSAHTWGYRVDGVAGFGAGPTSAVTNTSVPGVTFAAVPISTDTPGIVVASTTAADPGVTIPVWYGVCANTSTQSGTYSDNVVYTAVIN